jgi:uncharacterized protein
MTGQPRMLRADCYAGLWAHHATTAQNVNRRVLIRDLTKQDISARLDAASAAGDDRIQARYQGRVTPESWTYGSAARCQKWFLTRYRTGDFQSCDTYSGAV